MRVENKTTKKVTTYKCIEVGEPFMRANSLSRIYIKTDLIGDCNENYAVALESGKMFDAFFPNDEVIPVNAKVVMENFEEE